VYYLWVFISEIFHVKYLVVFLLLYSVAGYRAEINRCIGIQINDSYMILNNLLVPTLNWHKNKIQILRNNIRENEEYYNK